MNRARSVLGSNLVLGTAALGLVLGARGVRAEGPAPLHIERLVPARSIAFVSAEDVGTWGRRWEQTAIAKMLADPEMKGFLDPLKADFKKMVEAKGAGESPIPPVVWKVLEQLGGLSGQVGVALVDLDKATGPVLAAGLDFGPHLQDFLTFLQRMKAEMGDDLPIAASEKDGRTWWALGKHDHPDAYATAQGTSLLVSTDRTWLEAISASKGAALDGALGSSEAFQRTRTSAGEGDLAMFAFVNVPRVLDLLGEKMGPDARRTADALGLDTVKSAGYGMSFVGDGILDSVVVSAPGADHGLLPILKMRARTGKGLAIAPASAFWYEESTFPCSTMLAKVRDVLERIDPELVAKLTKFLAEAKSTTGVDLETDLLAQLADDTSLSLAFPETGGLYPEVALSMAVKDPAKFEATATRAVDGLLAKLGQSEKVSGTQRVIEWHGKRLHVIDLAGVKGKDMVPFTPTWTMLGDRFLVTLVPHAMKELLLRAEGAAGGLGSQEDVQALLKSAPQGSGSFVYLDLQGVLNLLYDTGVPLLQTVAKPNILAKVIPLPLHLDWAQLPATRSMRPYFRSLGAFASCDGESLRLSVHSPVGAVLPLAVVGVLAATVLGRKHHAGGIELATERPQDDRESQIMLADLEIQNLVDTLAAYSAAQRQLPATLEALLTETNASTGKAWLERLPKDPWGQPYAYKVKDGAKGVASVSSAGPDQTSETIDDIVHDTPAAGR